MRLLTALFLSSGLICAANAGSAEVVDAKATRSGDGTWRFDVTVRHADTGWEHYANSWQVLDAGGNVLATRVLAHPHVDEQPFTRSKSGIVIPEGTDSVFVRAGDSVHEFAGEKVEVKLEQ